MFWVNYDRVDRKKRHGIPEEVRQLLHLFLSDSLRIHIILIFSLLVIDSER